MYFSKKRQPISLSVKDFLESIASLPYPKKLIEVGGKKCALTVPYIEPATKLHLYSILKVRSDSNFYVGSLEDERIEEYDGHVLDITTFLYDEKKNLLIIEENRDGVSCGELVKYLNSFIEENEYVLETKQILESLTIEDIAKSAHITTIEIKVRLDGAGKSILMAKEEDYKNLLSVFSSPQQESFSADTITLVFKKRRGESLNIASVMTFLRLLNIAEDSVETVLVRFKHNSRMETLNLKDIDKPMKDVILQNSQMKIPLLSTIRDEIVQLYIDKRAGRFDDYYKKLIDVMLYFDCRITVVPPPQQGVLL